MGVRHHAGRAHPARPRRPRRPVSRQPRQPAARRRLAPPSRRRGACATCRAADLHRRALPHGHDGAESPPRVRSRQPVVARLGSGSLRSAARARHLRRRPAVRRREGGRRHARAPQPRVQGDPSRPARPARRVRGAPRATLRIREPVDVLQRSRLRRLDARRPTRMPRTHTTCRCCRCSSRRVPGGGSSSRRCTVSTWTRSPTPTPMRASS